MRYVGIDLHKKSITVCVVSQERTPVKEQRFECSDTEGIRKFFGLKVFQAVVEATASYEWLWQLLEPLANRLVLAHPRKLRIIAESTRKGCLKGCTSGVGKRKRSWPLPGVCWE